MRYRQNAFLPARMFQKQVIPTLLCCRMIALPMGKVAFLMPLLAVVLLIPPGLADAQQTPGEWGSGENAGPGTNTGAHADVPKPDSPYKNMAPPQQGQHAEPASKFISSGGAYELARNKLLIKLAELVLQIQLTADGKKMEELMTKHDGILDELEEFGVGPADKAIENSGYYFDKYDEALKRFEGRGHPATVHVGDMSLINQAGHYFHALQVHLTYLYALMLGFLSMALKLLV